jgi:hypothetical protein
VEYPLQTIQKQWSNSPAICQLVENFNQYFSSYANLNLFFANVWDIETAQGYGLQIWARIVGIGTSVIVSQPDFFGFSQGGFDGFGQGPFESASGGSSTYNLADPVLRQLILVKAMYNICDGSYPAVNQLMLNLFPGSGNAYVSVLGPLSIAYTFDYVLSPVQYAIVTQLDILPRPPGVMTTVAQP